MAKQEDEFFFDVLRFVATVVLLGLIVFWVRSGEPTIENTPVSTVAADHP